MTLFDLLIICQSVTTFQTEYISHILYSCPANMTKIQCSYYVFHKFFPNTRESPFHIIVLVKIKGPPKTWLFF